MVSLEPQELSCCKGVASLFFNFHLFFPITNTAYTVIWLEADQAISNWRSSQSYNIITIEVYIGWLTLKIFETRTKAYHVIILS